MPTKYNELYKYELYDYKYFKESLDSPFDKRISGIKDVDQLTDILKNIK